MDDSQAALALGSVRSQLATVLKSDVDIAMPSLSSVASGSFRSFTSRSISVVHVQGGAVSIRKGASLASDVHVLRIARGSARVAHADGSTTLRAGQFVAFRGARACEFRHDEDIDLVAMYLPARAVERWLPGWPSAEFIAVENQQPEGRLSFDIARDLLNAGAQLEDSAAELVGETVTRLFARSLSTSSLLETVAPDELAEAGRRRVRQFCRDNLGAAGLTVDTIARGTGLSRASLHRLFKNQEYTLMQWVQLERLEACRRLLETRRVPRRTLTEVALSQGFKTSAHFSAAFRQRYGLSPREYRAHRVR